MAIFDEVQLNRKPALRGEGARWLRRKDSYSVVAPRPTAPYAELSAVWEASPQGVVVPGYVTSMRRDALFRRLLALSDVLTALAALLLVVNLGEPKAISLRPAALVLAPLLVVAAKAIGLYDRDQHLLRKTTIDEAPQVLYLAILFALGGWLSEAVMLGGWLTRSQVFELTLLSFALMIGGRLVARTIAQSLSPTETCLVLGDAVAASRIVAKLEQTRAVRVNVIGRIPFRGDDADCGHRPVQRIGDYASLVPVVLEHGVERVIIAPGGDREDELLDAIRLIKALGVKVSVLPRLLEVVGSSSSFDDIDGICLLGVRHFGMPKSSAFLKRLMDFTGAIGALIGLAPLLAALALAIKLTSRGSVFFRQPRIGRNGERFAMLKFRSMVPGADSLKQTLRDRNEAEGGLFKIKDDPRITRVGHFLRRTSLDELPQLFNVLRGDMSLVGPRPLVPDEDALIEGWRRRRLAVRPGMTGLWQIFGSARIPMHEMVKIDYMYGANWSLWLDLKILLRTIPYVVTQRGL